MSLPSDAPSVPHQDLSSQDPIDAELALEAGRRRTFAIISHPDAGKTTLTEKILLYAGAIHLAGSVKSRRASRHAVSDWMEMEKERGISVTSSVLHFDHRGSALNLVDTPGHADFSEDTYRTLAAVDSSIMLIDHAKGVEARTLKLFEVCRLRKLPVITFINKLDRAGLEPLSLLDDLEKTLNLKTAPINWPIGMGRDFKGVVDLASRDLILYGGSQHGAARAEAKRLPWSEAHTMLSSAELETLSEELELLEIAGDGLSEENFLAGDTSPVFWGSAMTNFGVEPLLNFVADKAAPPPPRQATEVKSQQATTLTPTRSKIFTGFVFKIQANMNPRHRDRIAFVRVVSGRFERDMDAFVGRTQEKLKLAKPHSFVAQERAIVESAYPGDIIGLYDPGRLRIGDTLAAEKPLAFDGIPRFAPEHFAQLLLADPLRRKALDAGLSQLAHEGVVQLFYRSKTDQQDPAIGVVGLLQFEVLRERLKNEYNVKVKQESLPYRAARWVGGTPEGLQWLSTRKDYPLRYDRHQNPVVLVASPWALEYAAKNAEGLELFDIEPL